MLGCLPLSCNFEDRGQVPGNVVHVSNRDQSTQADFSISSVIDCVLTEEDLGGAFGKGNRKITCDALALAVTAWDFISSLLGAVASSFGWIWVAPALSTIVVFAGLASLAWLAHIGYGSFRFENTWADISCFVTEGYGMMFPISVAPLFAAITLIREVVLLRLQRRPSTHTATIEAP
jgi:hypothetical protein